MMKTKIFNKCVNNSQKKEDFEQRQLDMIKNYELIRWLDIMKNYELENNVWLASLFENQKYWVPILTRDTFLLVCLQLNDQKI